MRGPLNTVHWNTEEKEKSPVKYRASNANTCTHTIVAVDIK
jgi:hypothetical protein